MKKTEAVSGVPSPLNVDANRGPKAPAVRSWPARINAAEERGHFTSQDRAEAGDWPTCACGMLDAGIPRYEGYGPKDEILSNLGFGFDTAVCFNRFAEARSLISEITARAVVVLAEMRGAERRDHSPSSDKSDVDHNGGQP